MPGGEDGNGVGGWMFHLPPPKTKKIHIIKLEVPDKTSRIKKKNLSIDSKLNYLYTCCVI